MAHGRGQNRRKKSLIIIRGLPGVGKKSHARILLDQYRRADLVGQIYSASDYHAMSNWNKFYFARNHMWNRQDVFKAMKKGVNPIIVYNINSSLWHMWPYVAMYLSSQGMHRGDYHITMIERPEGYPKNPVSINKLYSACGCKIPKQKFRYWRNNWQKADNIWDVLHDSYSKNRWQDSEEEWNVL